MDDFVRTEIDNQVFLPMGLYVRARLYYYHYHHYHYSNNPFSVQQYV